MQLLAVPVDTKVHLYERGSWDHVITLSDGLITKVRSDAQYNSTVLETSVKANPLFG